MIPPKKSHVPAAHYLDNDGAMEDDLTVEGAPFQPERLFDKVLRTNLIIPLLTGIQTQKKEPLSCYFIPVIMV